MRKLKKDKEKVKKEPLKNKRFCQSNFADQFTDKARRKK